VAFLFEGEINVGGFDAFNFFQNAILELSWTRECLVGWLTCSTGCGC
jgi:hypothetical protein